MNINEYNKMMTAIQEAAKEAEKWGAPFAVIKWFDEKNLTDNFYVVVAEMYDYKKQDLIAIVFSNGLYQRVNYPGSCIKNIKDYVEGH